ncbi:MAG TPA: sulfatase-like hydrolase/transferase [Vicinamibacteria bacterium]|nr:sulfatase-like hydrolase/transferase [Vicinamibacteria bacterium]
MSRSRKRKPPSPASSPVGASPRRRLWAGVGFGAVLLLGVAAVVVLRPRPETTTRRAPLDVLLVTLDTTRADRLGCYGYATAKTRHLDRLAAEGARFETVVAPAPITLPSHSSILTGLYPFEHGVRNNGNFYLAPRFETLATRLKARGYRTGAFVSSFILDRRYGLDRGFDAYDDRMEGEYTQVVTLQAERRGDRTALALGRWIDERALEPDAPFFAWLHLYDPHEPYRPPHPFRDLFEKDPYEGEIAFVDAIVASVLDRLQGKGLLDRTLVVVAGDHGESLGEHGEMTHSMFVYEGVLRVPLILWRPGLVPPGRVVTDPVRLVDVAPTILDLVGGPALQAPHARSLVPLLEGRSAGPPLPAYSETLLPKFYMNWAPLRSLRDGRYKLIDAPRPELYDLATDPGEDHNLYGERRQTADALREGLGRLAASGDAMSLQTLDREAMEKLAALGYIGAGAEPREAGSGSLADPKDFIALFDRLRQANSAVRDRRFDEAIPVLTAVLAEDPKNAFANLILGSAYMGKGESRPAIARFRRYLELVPTSSYAHQWIAICHVRLGEREAALREAEAALALDPRFTDARVLKAGVLAARGEHEAAIAVLREAIATDTAKPMIRLDLAKVLAEAGRRDEARAEYETVLRLEPDSLPALTGLGALLAGQGDLAAAEATLRRALGKDPEAAQARFNLAQVLERGKRASEAATEYRRVAEDEKAPPDLRAEARIRLADGRRQ